MPNSYLAEKKRREEELLLVGMRIGEQFAIDMMQVALHRKKWGWGYQRVRELMNDIQAAGYEYEDILYPCMEQDIKQERLDRELRDLVKDNQEFIPCIERYKDVRQAGYKKMPKR